MTLSETNTFLDQDDESSCLDLPDFLVFRRLADILTNG